MIDDPYKVLGIARDATQQDIKSAYRKMAKKYHPDLNPNDAEANKKMNEVNEAYDMLMNPEKYARRKQQQSGNDHDPQGRSQRQNSNAYQGAGGWSSDFGGFSFDDIFGFGFAGGFSQTDTKPQTQPGDSWEIQQVIQCINNGRHHSAVQILTNIPSTGRNARWFYLSALANKGAGNTVRALEHIQRAVQLEPNNRTYHQVLQSCRQSEQKYERNAQDFNMDTAILPKLCIGVCIANMCCNPYACVRFY